MSTWTDEKHKAAREEAAGFIGHGGHRIRIITLSDALDEIERLRAESARRMVWLETEQRAHAQTHAALMDMTEKAAKPEVTDQMVEAAADAAFGHLEGQGWWNNVSGDAEFATLEGRFHLRPAARAALEAALNPPA